MSHPGWLIRTGGRCTGTAYRTIGEVDAIAFGGWEGLLELLEKPDVVDAARRTALGLMRKGRGMMAKYHDESLADDVFAVLEELGPGTGSTQPQGV